ncbi:MAG: hypothetical protein IKO84_11480 [Butyrivibrio sp.]|nr:hypothetical protein [Butyrivibrio sp.]
MSEIIKILKKNNIAVEKGMDDKEIEEIQLLYGIRFPKSLLELLQEGVPHSKGFLNWRDMSPDNIAQIKGAIETPIKDLSDNADAVYWNEIWGEEPDTSEEIAEYIRNKIITAPKLIPIYSHRYIPAGNLYNPPVFSVYDADVIYYGKDLEEYFQLEFGGKNQKDVDYSTVQAVPFWSELI